MAHAQDITDRGDPLSDGSSVVSPLKLKCGDTLTIYHIRGLLKKKATPLEGGV